jgi:potassium efflux system protein
MTRAIGAAFLLGVASLSLFAQTTNAPTAAAPAPPVTPTPPAAQPINEADIVARAQAVLDKYPAPDSAPDPVEADIRQQMADVEPKLRYFAAGENEQLAAQNPSVDIILTLEKWGDYFQATIGTKTGATDGWLQTLGKRRDELGAKLTAIQAEHTIWDDTAAELQKDPTAAPEYSQQVAEVQTRLDAVQRDTLTRQKNLRGLQQRAAADAQQITTVMTTLNAARARAISQLFERNTPPVWSFEDLATGDAGDLLSLPKQFHTLAIYSASATLRFVLHFFLLVVLIALFWWLRGYAKKLAAAEPGITPAAGIFETPISTALLLAIGASPLIYYPIAPRLLSAMLGAAALVPSVVLLRRLIEPRLFVILYALIAFYFLEEFRSVAGLSMAGARAFLLAEILAAVVFLGWLLLRNLRRGTAAARFSYLVLLGARVAFGVVAAGWLAEVLGYTLLANLLCVAVQRAATLALALYAGIRIVEALFFIGMRLRPLSTLGMVRLHGPELTRRLQHTLVGAAAIAWVIAVVEALPWAADLHARLFAFFAHYDNNNHLLLKVPGKIAVAFLIGFGVVQISRLTRFVLATDFYPRLRLSAGIPYAISMTLHYVLLTIAFIAVTAVLGVDMTKFTILVSALGVGVGFGLQNIINNFVSGLILLFERPVKIGDTIMTGTDTGTVERIGIRASVLRTPAGTEVIVPNGSLISSNVTNWTLSSQERIVLIPLNVPRGPDIAHLIGLLTAAAAANPKVLKHPPPLVVAQTLGPNLGLELRAWTRSSDDWTTVRSELVLAVNAALTRENITLA